MQSEIDLFKKINGFNGRVVVVAELESQSYMVLPTLEPGHKRELTTADKCRRLIHLIGFDDIPIRINEHANFALVPFGDQKLVIVHDGATTEEIDEIERQAEDFSYNHEIQWEIVTPMEFLTKLISKEQNKEFQDKRFSSKVPKQLKHWLLSRSDSRKMLHVLTQAGFKTT